MIFNPRARGADLKLLSVVVGQWRSSGLAVSVDYTTGPDMASGLAQRSTADVVVAAGGDGTIREVIDGLAGTPRVMAILPMGTANVLATEIGLTAPVDAADSIVESGIATPINLGRVGTRYFAAMVSVGFDADVVAKVNLGL